MTFKCLLGFHNWRNNCEQCSICGKKRKNQHNWVGCSCSLCDQRRAIHHDWTKDCEMCSICGKTKNEQHDWSKNCERCYKCGKASENHHDWNGCKCLRCETNRDFHHDWSTIYKCSICGKKLSQQIFECNDIERKEHFQRVLLKMDVYEKSDIYPDHSRFSFSSSIDLTLSSFKSLFSSKLSKSDGQVDFNVLFGKKKVEFRRTYYTKFGYSSITAFYIYRMGTDEYLLVDYYNDSTT